MNKQVMLTFNLGGNKKNWLRWVIVAFNLISILIAFVGSAMAQEEEIKAIQVLTGYYGNRRSSIYTLPNLKQGDTLYIYIQGTSGNLDPFVALADGGLDLSGLTEEVTTQLISEIEAGRDPLVGLRKFQMISS